MSPPRRAAAAAVVLALLCSALTVVMLHTLYPVPSPAGTRAAGGLLMAGERDTWTATLPAAGQTAPKKYVSAVRGCGSLFRWATGARAVPRGTVEVGYTVGAAPGSSTLVRGIRLVKGEPVEAPRGEDVGCVGRGIDQRTAYLGSQHDGGPMSIAGLSLDGGRSAQRGAYPVRAGGTISGIVRVSTRTCSCTWWLEADVEENGRPVTVRIDDDGRPFRIAPPVRALATPADLMGSSSSGTPLSRAAGDPSGVGGVSVSMSLYQASRAWRVSTDRAVDALSAIEGNLDVGGVACRRMYESLIDGGGVPAGHTSLTLQVSGPPDVYEATLDASVRIHRVELPAEESHQYSCAPPGVDVDDSEEQENPAESRSFYPNTLHALGPFASGSLKHDPDWNVRMSEGGEMPLAVDELMYLTRDGTGSNGGEITAGIGPEEATFHFTVDVTVTLPSGKEHSFELTDHGKPFVVAPDPGQPASLHRTDYHEAREGPSSWRAFGG